MSRDLKRERGAKELNRENRSENNLVWKDENFLKSGVGRKGKM